MLAYDVWQRRKRWQTGQGHLPPGSQDAAGYQCVVGRPGAVESQRCVVEPSKSTSNQQATPCTLHCRSACVCPRASGTPGGSNGQPQITGMPLAQIQKGQWQACGYSVTGGLRSGCKEGSQLTGMQAEGDADVMQLLLLDAAKVEDLGCASRHKHAGINGVDYHLR